MNRAPIYAVAWSAHSGHPWNVLSSKCAQCRSAILRIVWGRR